MSGAKPFEERTGLEVAIIGLAGRFPGAFDVHRFWANLRAGEESFTELTDEEMIAAGGSPEAIRSPRWVRRARVIEGADQFDAGFFAVSPREADLIDPQQRVFLECSWAALEDAGYDADRLSVPVGVFAGSRFTGYLLNVYSNRGLVSRVGDLQVQISNDKDYVATRVSYKLDLGGPSMTVQTACSTTLVAVHLACQALNSGECGMALAGGVGIRVPEFGYPYTEGDVASPDGRIRPFDAQARGTVFGSGLGAVVLKRLEDALADGDNVRAVILGSAVTNDGAAKVGFTAPGVDGQYRVVRAAQIAAEVEADSITYVEAHGTGTPMGDPIEVEALTRAFRDTTDRRGYCALASVKGNIGHLGAAAGAASLIKTVLALEHREIPPSILFEQPNPQIDFENSPFYVNTELREWPANGAPRRAGVSAFGIGGTNAHLVLEEAPPVAPADASRPWQLLLLSARSASALEAQRRNLAGRLGEADAPGLADVAYTLQVGRRIHAHRMALVCRDREEAMAALTGEPGGRTLVGLRSGRKRSVAFLFSGQGSQYPGMTRGLYDGEPVYRECLDRCLEVLAPLLEADLRSLLFPEPGAEEAAAEALGRTAATQPALFAVEYSLAKLWESWGVRPEAMAGHSIGEYVAACLAGVLSLEDALALVAARGRLMEELPGGDMLAVPLSEDEVAEHLGGQLSVAAVNAVGRSVVSGPAEAVAALRETLETRGLACRPLHTSHAFHSAMMEPIFGPFVERFAGVSLQPPQIPFVSNVTGTWITDQEATDPGYWARHLRGTVRFAAGVGELLAEEDRVLLEVGPGNSLTTLARRHPARKPEQDVVASTRHPKEPEHDQAFLLKSLGQLWIAGAPVDWEGFYGEERRRRVPLPTYPFERQRYWIEAWAEGDLLGGRPGAGEKRTDLSEWFYVPSWKPSVVPASPDLEAEPRAWLLFVGDDPLSAELAATLGARGQRVVTVRPGEGFARDGEGAYRIAPGGRDDYGSLVKALAADEALPDVLVHLWNLGPAEDPGLDGLRAAEDRAFWSHLFLAQALGRQGVDRPVSWLTVSSHMQRVRGETALCPERATLLGPVKVIPLEYPNLRCRSLDVLPGGAGPEEPDSPGSLAALVLAEATADSKDRVVALRDGERWVLGYEAVPLAAPDAGTLALRDGGVYLITGGLGGIGLSLAEYLAREHRARLALLGLSALPGREGWDEWLETHGAGDRTSDKIRKVRRLEELGAEVLVLAADVADPGPMREVVHEIVERFGALHGVVHAAGLAGGGMIQLKGEDVAERVLSPKVRGTLVLESVLEEAGLEPDFLFLCSSTIACLGGLGQVDYCAANSFLDAFAHRQRLRLDQGTTRVRTVSVNWGAWEEVGMAVAAGLVAGSAAEARGPVTAGPVHPLVDRCLREASDQTIYATDFSPERQWVLAEHRILGTPALPGTAHLEIARAVFTHHASNFEQLEPGAPVEIRDLFFLTPLLLPPGDSREAHIFLERAGGGRFKFRLATRAGGTGDDGIWQPHSRGVVGPAAAGEAPRLDLEAIRARCGLRTLEIDGPLMNTEGEGVVFWGDHWQSLRTIWMGEDEGLARLELPRGVRGRDPGAGAAPRAAGRGHRHHRIHRGGQLPAAVLRAGGDSQAAAAKDLQPLAQASGRSGARDPGGGRDPGRRRRRGAGRDRALRDEEGRRRGGELPAPGGAGAGAGRGGRARARARRAGGHGAGGPPGRPQGPGPGPGGERDPSLRGRRGLPARPLAAAAGTAGRHQRQGPLLPDRADRAARPGTAHVGPGGRGDGRGDPRPAQPPDPLRRTAHRGRATARRDLAGGAGHPGDRDPRQLLRPRRRLGDGHPARGAGQRERLRALSRPALRAPDGGGAGGGGERRRGGEAPGRRGLGRVAAPAGLGAVAGEPRTLAGRRRVRRRRAHLRGDRGERPARGSRDLPRRRDQPAAARGGAPRAASHPRGGGPGGARPRPHPLLGREPGPGADHRRRPAGGAGGAGVGRRGHAAALRVPAARRPGAGGRGRRRRPGAGGQGAAAGRTGLGALVFRPALPERGSDGRRAAGLGPRPRRRPLGGRARGAVGRAGGDRAPRLRAARRPGRPAPRVELRRPVDRPPRPRGARRRDPPGARLDRGGSRGRGGLAHRLPRGRPRRRRPRKGALQARGLSRMSRRNVEDIYRLSPVQQGMLFHTLLAPGTGVYFEQFALRYDEGFDAPLFEEAWRRALARHPVLRTAFVWEDLEEPLQVVHREVELPVERLDWRALPPDEQEERFAAYLAEDRRRGFRLDQPPLLRLAVVRVGEAQYRAVWSYHHLLLDGWSAGLLMREVFALFRGLAAGVPPALPERRPFREYIAWLRRQDLGEAREYWRRHLAGFRDPTPLAIDRPAAAGEDRGYELLVRPLPAATTARLKAFAQSHRLTFNTLVQGAWALVLARYAGRDDVLFGVTLAGRPPALAGVDTMLGCFINTLPFRVRLDPDAPVLAWLEALQADQTELRRFEHSPLVEVQAAAEVARDRELFESILVFESFTADAAFEMSHRGVFQRTNYPLTLVASPGERLVLRAGFELARLEPADVDRLLGHLGTALAELAGDPRRRLRDLALVDPEERRRALGEWNRPEVRFPAVPAVHERFAERAARAPDRVALSFEDRRVTYGALGAAARRLAARLRREGVGPDALVGLCAERSVEMVVGILGILEAGGAYVPLDPAAPAERLRWIVEDSGVPAVVTTAATAEALPAGPRLVLLDAEGEAPLAGEPVAGAGGAPDPDRIAYVIYTSGSTGRPKGSLIRHGSVARLFDATGAWFSFGPDDVWTLFHSYAFDFSVWELWGALAYGGRLVVVPYWVSRSPDAFLDLLRRERVTVLNQTPSAFKQLVAAEAAVSRAAAEPALATVVFGGEALELSSLAPWFARHGDRRPRLVNMYGITETTVHVTYRPVAAVDLEGRPGSPVGEPIPDLQVHLLDPWMNLVPVGVPGEIHVGGAGLARGYLARPALTAERFVPDPFAAEAGVPEPGGRRLYKAGDLARRLPDGGLDFLGRIDQQVKVRGFRIELGEIEAVLCGHPAVARAAVVARRDAPGDLRLVAYVVPAPGESPGLAELREHAGRFLPDYMVPAAFVELAELPLTVNGKLDRECLPAPEGAERLQSERAFRPPSSPTEEVLAGIWREVLKVERVGRDDDFFDLGGHSLLATRVVSRVNAALGAELPLMALFQAPSLAGLGAEIDRLRGRGGEAEPIPKLPRDQAPPLSHAQERLWFLDRFEPESPLYNLPSGFQVQGRLEAGRLARALADVIRRHESLRTTFAEAADGPVQVIHQAVAPALAVVDLGGLPEAVRRRAAKRAARAEVRRPFDLTAGPLLRTVLLRQAPERHLVLLTLHHAITDGTSEGILVRDLLACYAGPEAVRSLPTLPVQYADFAAWQRRRLAGPLLGEEVDHWRSYLAGAPPRLDLPTDRPRPPVQSFRGATRRVLLAAELAGRVRELARRTEATPFMVLLAGYAAALALHSGQDDVVVGTPVEGRLRPEVEELVGFFVNTLPLRVEVPAGGTFADLVARARTATLEAQEHQEVPFEKLVEELAPERDLGYTPLFQVMLILQAASSRPAPPAGLDLELSATAVVPSTGVSKFDLSLSFVDTGAELVGHWAYAVDLFDAATVARFGAHLETLLAAGCADPAVPVAALPSLPAAERHQALVEWNAPAVEHPAEGFVDRMVAGCAAEAPDRVAVVFDGAAAAGSPAAAARLTYGELDRRASALAARLGGSGIGPEERVGVFQERFPGLVVALLGVLGAGGAYVPLDPALPADRLRFLAGDAGLRTILVSGETEPRARELFAAARLVVSDGAGPRPDLPAARRGRSPEEAAYVLYTSGSTGRPKGVVISHRALGNRLEYARAGDVGPEDAFLQKTTISFDVSVAEVFCPLVAGGRTVLPAAGGEKDPRYLVDLIARERVTLTSFPPTLLYGLLDEEGFRSLDSLRMVITGGETVPAELPGRFHRHLGGAVLANRYGPTEATVSVTSWPCPPGTRERVVPIGRPTARAELLVLDPGLRPVPMGVVGEVALGGPGVARGYLARPGRTAASFVPHPFARAGERVYRSGDLGRLRPDGALEFAGRIDDQVKIRGFRVELGEIEAVLSRHPSVRAVAVVDHGEGADKAAIAYVVPEEGERVDPAALRDFAGEALPPYMVPSSITVMDALPLSPTGKVDRRALPLPDTPAEEPAEAGEAPRGAVEEVLAAIWGDVLGREVTGREQDFFDLGGHSLLATRVVSRLRVAFGVDLPLRRLFEAPTVAGLARAVEELRAAAPGGPGGAPPIVALPRPESGPVEMPLSFAQERLWFLERMEQGAAAYNMLSALRLHGRLDVAALRRAVAEMVRRHETLRTVFAVRDGEPVQRIRPWRAPELPVIDLSGLPAAARELEVAGIVRREERRRFDLVRGPLFRPALLRAGAADHVFLASMHHIVSDAWSLGVTVRELATFYRREADPAGRAGRAPAPPPVQYADFAVWQREWLRGAALEAQLAYWRSRLAGARRVLDLPTDRPRPPVLSSRGEVIDQRLPRALADRLRELARRGGATLFMVLMAGFQALLERYTGQGDLTVGTTIANRARSELEGLIGFFVNALALRGDLSDDPSFERLLDRVREESLGAYDHQDLPFEKLVHELQPERDLSRSPLFQVLLQLQNAPVERLELPGLVLSPVTRESSNAKFDLILNLFEGPFENRALFAQWRYRTDLFDRSTVERMGRHLAGLLAAAADDPGRPISRLPLLAPGERHQLLHELAGGHAEHRVAGTLDAAFGERAAGAPDAIAVVAGGSALSYGELEGRAAALAARLAAAGVAPGTRVALLLDRSPDLVVAVLGVLRAGGAYLPLDPAYPPERLAFMLEDSGAPVVVTRGELTAELPEVPGVARWLLDDEPGPAAGPGLAGPARPAAAGPEDVAYVIYTSGSTGRPKGVPVRHGNVLRLFAATDEWFGFGAADTWTLFHSYAFDFSVWEALGAAPPRRPAGRRLPRGQPHAGGAPPAPRPRAGDLPQPDAVGLPPARARRRRGRRAAGVAQRDRVRRRGPRDREPGPLVQPLRRPPSDPGQHVRDHRDHGPRDLPADPRARPGGGSGERRRPADPRPLVPRRRPVPAPGAPGGRGRDPGRRRGPRARLPRAPRPHRRALRARPGGLGRGPGGRPPLPERRPGAPPRHRGRRVPRPDRPSGEDPRLPDRARRDRVGPRRPPRGGRGRGGDRRGAGRRRGGPAPGGLRGARARGGVRRRGAGRPHGRRAPPFPGRAPARIHGAGRLRHPRRDPAHAQRQGGPARAAAPRPGAGRAGHRLRGAARRAGARPGGALAGSPGSRAGGRRRRLLRPRGQLARRRGADRSAPGGARRDPARGGALRRAHRGADGGAPAAPAPGRGGPAHRRAAGGSGGRGGERAAGRREHGGPGALPGPGDGALHRRAAV